MADITPKSLMLIGMAGEFHIHLIYGEKIGDPRPIILTVTPEYVAHKTSKSLPIHPSPDHAPRGVFLQLRREGARGRSDQMVGVKRLAIQRVWG